jgi:hypothetical protein
VPYICRADDATTLAGSETLSDEKATNVLRKLQKMRQESIEMFKAAPGREDMVEAEQVRTSPSTPRACCAQRRHALRA